MNCIKCQREMGVQAEHETENSENGRKYHKTVYWCHNCDIWLTTEIPYKQVSL